MAMKPATSAIKFVGSTSAASGQNAILAGVKNTKFGKTKSERKSPSAERADKADKADDDKADKADTDGEWNLTEHAKIMARHIEGTDGKIEANTDADEDMTELERQASEDKKRHKAAIDGDGDRGSSNLDAKLEKERCRRLDLEESLDEVKRSKRFKGRQLLEPLTPLEKWSMQNCSQQKSKTKLRFML